MSFGQFDLNSLYNRENSFGFVLFSFDQRILINMTQDCQNRYRSALSWKVGQHDSARAVPETWIPAQVPGAVQLDWAAAHGIPDYWVGDNINHLKGLENSYWTYLAKIIHVPVLLPGQSLFLVLEGVDYACDVFVEDRNLLYREGLQTRIDLDVTDLLYEGVSIRVRVHPAPKSVPLPEGRVQANRSCKPPVAYLWDFHPYFIPLGLWREAYLEVRPTAYFARPPEIHYKLNETYSGASGKLEVCLGAVSNEDLKVHWELFDPDGISAFKTEFPIPRGHAVKTIPFSLDSVDLWWPNGQGLPSLYTSKVKLVSLSDEFLDRAEVKVGFRSIHLVLSPGQWDMSDPSFPLSRPPTPITLQINGRSIFAKGSNWVCPDIFPGTLTQQRYLEQLNLVHDSNFNLLRLWGGACAPQDCFYEICDRLGIMLWQEFPLACNRYPDDAPYLAILDQESRSLIERLRSHPSLVIWCGGNELFWSEMTDQSLPIRLLGRNCYDLDPGRPFLSTSPLEGMAHGHYRFRISHGDMECWEAFQRSNFTAYAEFGCPGPASIETLRRILPEAEQWPPKLGTAWETHNGFGAWMSTSWLHLEDQERYFGACENLEQLVERGQFLQAVGFQGLFEEARRKKPCCNMALNWCLNEPWPCVANNSLISWPTEPKPALAAVAQACRPTLVSARIRKLSWKPGEIFDPELWILHDGPEPVNAVKMEAHLELDGVLHFLLAWCVAHLPANQNSIGPKVQFILPSFTGPIFKLHLEVSGKEKWNSIYLLTKEIVKNSRRGIL